LELRSVSIGASSDTALDRIIKLLGNRSPLVGGEKGDVQLGFAATGRDARRAFTDVQKVVGTVLEEFEAPWAAVKDLRIVSNDVLDHEIAAMPSCVGVREAAEILGVSKQRVGQLAKKSDFPKPVLHLRATPVWREADIRKFTEGRAS
jgi:predicted DNA-binding transcriptional regulator AlpA